MSGLWKKELRLVMPTSLGVIGIVFLVDLLGFGGFRESNLVALLLVGIVAVSSLGYGKELEHQTLDLQLTIPVSKQRILATKLIALLAAVLPLLALLSLTIRLYPPPVRPAVENFDPLGLWAALVCSSVSLFTWRLRSMIAGASVGGLVSLVWFGLAEPAIWTMIDRYVLKIAMVDASKEAVRELISAMLVAVLCVFHYRSWMRGEIRGRMTAESGIHNWSLSTSKGGSNRRRPLLNLVFKELWLQKPAIFVTMACVAFSLLTYVFRGVFPEGGSTTYLAGGAMLIGIVPLLIGCTAFGEERSLHSLQPSVMIPRPWLIVFTIKGVTSWVLAAALGAALPLLLEALSGGQNLNPAYLFAGVSSAWAIGFFSGSVSTGTVKSVASTAVVASLLTFSWLFWRDYYESGFAEGGLTGVIRSVWDLFPDSFSGEEGRIRYLRVVGLIYGGVTSFCLIRYAWVFGRRPEVSPKDMVKAVAVVLAVSTPFAGLVRESMLLVSKTGQ